MPALRQWRLRAPFTVGLLRQDRSAAMTDDFNWVGAFLRNPLIKFGSSSNELRFRSARIYESVFFPRLAAGLAAFGTMYFD